MKRANRSAKEPNASASYVGRLTSGRRTSWGVSSRARRSAMGGRPSAGGVVAPVLREHMVEQVVDRDGAEQPPRLVHDRRRDQVVGREVGCDLADGRLGTQRVEAGVDCGGSQ